MLAARGWTRAHRNFDSGSAGGGDIAKGPAGVHLECKRQERLAIPAWLRQAESEADPTEIPVVVWRQNRGKWYGAIELDELLALFALREMGT